MVETLFVVTERYLEAIREKLSSEIISLIDRGISVKISEGREGAFSIFVLTLADTAKDALALARYSIAQAVSRVIVEEAEPDFIGRAIKKAHPSLDESERQKIVERAKDILLGSERLGSERQGIGGLDGGRGATSRDDKHNRRADLLAKLLDYLRTNSTLAIEGFFRFRLQDYIDELHAAIESAIDGYLVEKEYREFIRLLRYFVEIQEPRFDEIQVVLWPDGSFELLDSNNNPIENEYLKGLGVEVGEGTMDYDDLLMSALIAIAPRRVVLHSRRSSALTEMIKGVFENRTLVCPGCPLDNLVRTLYNHPKKGPL